MSDHIWKAYAHGMNVMMKEGGIYISSLLLKSYRALGINDSEAMLMLQIIQFAEQEGITLATPEELGERMGVDQHQISIWLSSLLSKGLLTIEQDEQKDVISERYNWTGWYIQASTWYAKWLREQKSSDRAKISRVAEQERSQNLFVVFEQEFGRLLSPMEYETINGWLEQDRYSEEIILFALKEAVFAGKLSFRYIDRILIEWSRHRITNAEEAKAHTQRFYQK